MTTPYDQVQNGPWARGSAVETVRVNPATDVVARALRRGQAGLAAVIGTAVTAVVFVTVLINALPAAASIVPRTIPLGMVLQPALLRMEQAALLQPVEEKAFSEPGLTGASGTAVTTLIPPNAVVYRSYGDLKNDFASGKLPRRYKWIIFDLERWKLTPLWQQRRPTYTEQLAKRLVHAHGMKLINTPAVNLLTSMGYTQTQANYLKAWLAGGAAKYGDAMDIQAQRWDRNTTSYAAFVKKARAQALNAHPGVPVLAGLSTCASNVPVTSGLLVRDYDATVASGYWLNVAVWPACPDGNPHAAVQFLNEIYGPVTTGG